MLGIIYHKKNEHYSPKRSSTFMYREKKRPHSQSASHGAINIKPSTPETKRRRDSSRSSSKGFSLSDLLVIKSPQTEKRKRVVYIDHRDEQPIHKTEETLKPSFAFQYDHEKPARYKSLDVNDAPRNTSVGK